jgi:hypothetical protein
VRHVRGRRPGSADGGKIVARERFRDRLMIAGEPIVYVASRRVSVAAAGTRSSWHTTRRK